MLCARDFGRLRCDRSALAGEHPRVVIGAQGGGIILPLLAPGIVAFEFGADQSCYMARMPSAVEQGIGHRLHTDRAQEEVIWMAQSLPRTGRQSVERSMVVGFRPATGIIVAGRVKQIVRSLEIRT
ncbi:MAG: hypothetical protein ACK56I_13055, partial [bacterium]